MTDDMDHRPTMLVLEFPESAEMYRALELMANEIEVSILGLGDVLNFKQARKPTN